MEQEVPPDVGAHRRPLTSEVPQTDGHVALRSRKSPSFCAAAPNVGYGMVIYEDA
jgi:hypothetical protein